MLKHMKDSRSRFLEFMPSKFMLDVHLTFLQTSLWKRKGFLKAEKKASFIY